LTGTGEEPVVVVAAAVGGGGTGGLKKKGEGSFPGEGERSDESPIVNCWWRWSTKPNGRPAKPE